MKGKRLLREFYCRAGEEVAPDLLGKYLIRKIGNKKREGKITEIELYKGVSDSASHAYGGRVTSRNKAMWADGGFLYVYFIYGMYWMLNISVSRKGIPDCILIRGIDTYVFPFAKTDGPGKICKHFEINDSFYMEDITESKRLWVEDRGIDKEKIIKTKRIGINSSREYWKKRKLRFLLSSYQC